MEVEIIKTVQELIMFVKNVSPEVWEILIWQQTVVFICVVIPLVFTLAGLGVGFWLLFKGDTEDIGAPMIIIFGFLACVCFLVFFIEGIPRLLNPDYYALMALKP